MDVRRLMSRLNPQTANYEGGRGGIPEITPQDIAAALGTVHDEFAREVFCACWWQEGSKLTLDRLIQLLGDRQYVELDKQYKRAQRISLEIIAIDDRTSLNGVARKTDIADRARFESMLRLAEKSRWSVREPVMFGRIRKAVLAEMTHASLCTACRGRTTMMIHQVLTLCPRCKGTGLRGTSNRQRAERIGRDESNYRREWAPCYEFTFKVVTDAERYAASKVEAALEPVMVGKAFDSAGHPLPGY